MRDNSVVKLKTQDRLISSLLLALLIIGCQDTFNATTISPSVPPSARITATEFGGSAIVTEVPTVIPPTLTPALPTGTPTKSLPTATATSTSSPNLALSPIAISPLIVHFIDVGQGSSILIHAPDGTAGLIDGGEPSTGVVAYLQSQEIKINISKGEIKGPRITVVPNCL